MSAVAVKAGATRIQFQIVDGSIQVLLDGAVTHPDEQPQPFDSGLILTRDSSSQSLSGYRYRLTWPDGLEVEVDGSGSSALSLAVEPPASAAGQFSGLLGDFDGNPDNDPTTHDGIVLPASPTHDELYRQFADSWRVTEQTSLFNYPSGRSTADYTDSEFPSQSLAAPSEEQRRSADFTCRTGGLSDGMLLDACILDVLVTKDPSFATAAAGLADEAADAAEPGSETPPPTEVVLSDNFAPGLTVEGQLPVDAPSVDYRFSATAGQVAYLRGDASCSDPRPQWTVGAESGRLGEYHGVVDVCADLGRVSFAEDGTYVMRVSGPGGYRLSWIVVPADSVRSLAVGTPVEGTFTAPGERHIHVFDVTDGQTLTFDSELPCGPRTGLVWYLTTANGESEGRGIADLCTDFGPIKFGHDGAYRLVIDSPSATAVGSYQFTVRQ